MAVDLFESRTMLDALEENFAPRSFLLNTFFPQVDTHDSEYVDIDIIKGKRRMAPFVSPRAQGKVMARDGRTTRSYKAPYVKPKRECNAEEVIRKRATGAPLHGGPGPMMKAAEMLGKDLVDLSQSIERREEWMAAQAMFTGKIIVTGVVDDGDDSSVVDDEIDFGMAASHKLTLGASSRWGDSGIDPIEDLRTWKRLIAQDSGTTARNCVLGASVVDVFMSTVATKLDTRRIDLGQIVPQELPDGVTYLGYLNYPGLDLWAYDEWYVDDDGNEQPMVPLKSIAMAGSNARATRHYGAITDLEAIEQGLSESRYFPKSWLQKDPSVRWVMVQSRPVVIPHQIDAFLTAQVLA